MARKICSLLLVICLNLLIGDGESFKIQRRIINGFSSHPGQFPFFAFLAIARNYQVVKTCGGTLINNQWVLTTAECLNQADEVAIHLGMTELVEFTENGRLILTAFPPSFHITNDIALIKLTNPIAFTDRIQPVKLPKTCETSELNVIAIGSGRTNNAFLAPVLQWAFMKTTGRHSCNTIFPFADDSNNLICAWDENSGICDNEFGSPLIRQDNKELIGVAAYMHPDGKCDEIPQGFFNVLTYGEWIANTANVKMPRCSFD